MSTGEHRGDGGICGSGFTVLEMLVGITLTALLVVGVSPLVLGIQGAGICDTDRTVGVLQGRVAAARLERDLRTATAAGCPFAVGGPVLQATTQQVVFLGRRAGSTEPVILEWEIAGSTLMRRWAHCPEQRPESFAHSLYVDNKTMLEGLAASAMFEYTLDGVSFEQAVAAEDLARVTLVRLTGGGVDAYGVWPSRICSESLVGR